jgi:hypothetical protein
MSVATGITHAVIRRRSGFNRDFALSEGICGNEFWLTFTEQLVFVFEWKGRSSTITAKR